MENKKSYLLRRKAAKGGKKYAGWKQVSTVQAIANILIVIISDSSLRKEA
jgi:hypothetical protein